MLFGNISDQRNQKTFQVDSHQPPAHLHQGHCDLSPLCALKNKNFSLSDMRPQSVGATAQLHPRHAKARILKMYDSARHVRILKCTENVQHCTACQDPEVRWQGAEKLKKHTFPECSSAIRTHLEPVPPNPPDRRPLPHRHHLRGQGNA